MLGDRTAPAIQRVRGTADVKDAAVSARAQRADDLEFADGKGAHERCRLCAEKAGRVLSIIIQRGLTARLLE